MLLTLTLSQGPHKHIDAPMTTKERLRWARRALRQFSSITLFVAAFTVPLPTPADGALKWICVMPAFDRAFPHFRCHSHFQPFASVRFPELPSPGSTPWAVAAKAYGHIAPTAIIAHCYSPEKKKDMWTSGWWKKSVFVYRWYPDSHERRNLQHVFTRQGETHSI